LINLKKIKEPSGIVRIDYARPVGAQGFGERSMLSMFRRLKISDFSGTAIEYTLIISIIALAALTSMKTIGGKLTILLGGAILN
jgi:pilus assembly protein Flp/PilA